MKQRFTHILAKTFMSLIIFCLIFSLYGQSPQVGQKDMYLFAGKELPRILAFIPQDHETEYGFTNREEFANAALGIPYQEYSLETEMPTGFWRIPVTVAGENRALLRLVRTEGKWTFAGFGGARLAKELGVFEKSKNKPASGRIVRDFEMTCDYVQYNLEPGAKVSGLLFPMESAARFLLRTGSVESVRDSGYSLGAIKEIRARVMKITPKEK